MSVPLENIYEVSLLSEAAQKIATTQPGTLNLVRPDWKKVMENDPTIQLYQKGSKVYLPLQTTKTGDIQKVSLSNLLYVVVVGKWSLYTDPEKNYTILITQECEPLQELVRLLTKDVDNEKYKIPDPSFFVEVCNPIYCRWCRNAREKLKMGLVSSPKEWCILKTRVYDGERIKNVFKSSIENNFRGQQFYGILKLQLNQRFFYKNKIGENCCKLSGVCKDMILFKETCLVTNPELELDYVQSLEPESSSCKHDAETDIVHEELDFLDTVHLAYTKRPLEETTENESKKLKSGFQEDETIPCIPENVSFENENDNDYIVTSNVIKF